MAKVIKKKALADGDVQADGKVLRNRPPETADIDILAPDLEIEIKNEKVVVRELTFGEQLRHAQALADITEALRGLMKPGSVDDLGGVVDALEARGDSLTQLMAVSTGKDAAWIASLSGEAGETLMLTWWRANQHFFIRRLVLYPTAGTLNGAASSRRSSATATGQNP
jgi:hypothetical protein